MDPKYVLHHYQDIYSLLSIIKYFIKFYTYTEDSDKYFIQLKIRPINIVNTIH